ncbi:hypothetical protein L1S32_02510 [Methanogenium sp. S4BF]|uniref:hypothetical protein n=1 Tax=Methanogenium sp. S4BF TaxID=1789226 RepID=UPI0024159710|nr:hypothetical protein [Methanogenium sp. S4BF]WFN35009.1 hypothetical protein L1S32_02510 [Methanogenium sp. S4BF]
MNTNLDQINKYLWCGYLPPNEFPTWLSECITPDIAGKTYSPHEAAKKFDLLFDNLVDQSSSGHHVIPLSGGWDSRTILGALLERVDANQIMTVTFGVPGQLDYDLGKMVAESAGVKNYAIDLRTIDFTWEAIKESVAKSPWTSVPDGMFNAICRNISNKDDTIWSGFIGDAINGGHLSDLSMDPEIQISAFSKKERRVKNCFLCQSGFSFQDVLPVPDINSKNYYEDALLLGLHCTTCTAPINLPVKRWEGWGAVFKKEMNGIQVIAPFVDAEWAGYWLSAPREVRKGQKLYLDMLNLKFPELFSLPGKSNYGSNWSHGVCPVIKRGNHIIRMQIQRRLPWLRIRSSLNANYLDYDEMFRKRDDYHETLMAALDYLKENKVVPWLDLDALCEEHMKRRKDHGDAFLVLIGLAANLIENPLNDN